MPEGRQVARITCQQCQYAAELDSQKLRGLRCTPRVDRGAGAGEFGWPPGVMLTRALEAVPSPSSGGSLGVSLKSRSSPAAIFPHARSTPTYAYQSAAGPERGHDPPCHESSRCRVQVGVASHRAMGTQSLPSPSVPTRAAVPDSAPRPANRINRGWKGNLWTKSVPIGEQWATTSAF
jgi:hypothetical protein